MNKRLQLFSLGVLIPGVLVLLFLLAYAYFVGFDVVKLSNLREVTGS